MRNLEVTFNRHCESDFFEFFYCSSHQFFDILQQNGCSKNPKASPLLHFSALCDLPETSKKFDKKFGIFFSIFSFLRAFVVSSCRRSGFRFRVFLSLRYGADLGRSRLVSFLSVLSRLCHALLVSWSAFVFLYMQSGGGGKSEKSDRLLNVQILD